MKEGTLQWGGRFAQPPDAALLAFGSSLEDDLLLAPFDVRCSLAHVAALEGGKILPEGIVAALRGALRTVEKEIGSGAFVAWARASGAEDIHGAIDARVRELCPGGEGEYLHAGRSRNDQVATTLALFARDRAEAGAALCREIGHELLTRAKDECAAGTMLAATTHWQPAQPVLLAFWLAAAAEPFVRAVRRFERAREDATRFSPLGSAAVAGSCLPLDRRAAADALGFDEPSRNAMDSIGTRDAVLDVAHAFSRALVDASRISGELVIWCAPAFGYARLGDASSTGSSLMPQKRNPDPFELVRAYAAETAADYGAAVEVLRGTPLSYHRDLQVCKRLAMAAIERGHAALGAFSRALRDLHFDRSALSARAADGYTVATDVADALILSGISARRAHELVGAAVATAERESRPLQDSDLQEIAREVGLRTLQAPLDAYTSVRAKRTAGSTHPEHVGAAIRALEQSFDSAQDDNG